MSITDITTQVPVVHPPTSFTEAKSRAGELAQVAAKHARTGAVAVAKTWVEITKTSPQGLDRSWSKVSTYVADTKGGERADSLYRTNDSLTAHDRPSASVAEKASSASRSHTFRVARRSCYVGVPTAALAARPVWEAWQYHVTAPWWLEAAQAVQYGVVAGLAGSALFGLIGHKQASESVARLVRRNRINDEALRKALRSLGISALRKDLEQEKPDTRIGHMIKDTARNTISTTVELPDGVDIQELLVPSRRRRLASNLHKSEAQVILAEGSDGHELVITIYKDDPTKRAAETWPLAGKLLNIFDAFPLGMDAGGEVVNCSFDESHIYIAGASRWGKSVTMRTLIATVALDPRVRIWIWNGTEAATFASFEDIAEVFENGNATTSATIRAKGARIFELLSEEMDDRGKILADLKRDKVDNDCAHVDGLNPIVVFMDELAPLFAADRELLGFAADVAQQCLKYGIFLVCATQTFDKNAVPWSFVGKFGKKIVHRLEKDSDHQAVFDRDYATQGINACKIRTKGEAILDGEESGHRTLRVYMTDDQTRAEAVQVGLRGRGGEVAKLDLTPPKPEPVDENYYKQPEQAKRRSTKFPHLLQDIAEMMRDKNEWRLWFREIAPNLPERPEYVAAFPKEHMIKGYYGPNYITLTQEVKNILGDDGIKKSMKKNGEVFAGVLADAINAALEGTAA